MKGPFCVVSCVVSEREAEIRWKRANLDIYINKKDALV